MACKRGMLADWAVSACRAELCAMRYGTAWQDAAKKGAGGLTGQDPRPLAADRRPPTRPLSADGQPYNHPAFGVILFVRAARASEVADR